MVTKYGDNITTVSRHPKELAELIKKIKGKKEESLAREKAAGFGAGKSKAKNAAEI